MRNVRRWLAGVSGFTTLLALSLGLFSCTGEEYEKPAEEPAVRAEAPAPPTEPPPTPTPTAEPAAAEPEAEPAEEAAAEEAPEEEAPEEEAPEEDAAPEDRAEAGAAATGALEERTKAAEPTPTEAEEEEEEAAAPEGDSDLSLIGIVRAGGQTPSAVIAYQGSQEIFRKGDPVFGQGTLAEVGTDSVVVDADGDRTTLRLPTTEAEEPPPTPEPAVVEGERPPTAPAPPPVTESISRAEAQAAFGSFSDVLDQAGAERVAVGGSHGIKLGDVSHDSFLGKLGLKSGDILQRINDRALTDPDELPDLSATGSEITVTFVRDGVGLTISRKLR